MKPIDPGSDHGRLAVFAADQAPYAPLPSRVSENGVEVTTRWQLDDEERLAIAAGGDVLLTLMTFGQPLQPVRFRVAGLDDVMLTASEEPTP